MKNKKNNTPRRKRMKQHNRLEVAKSWIQTYKGKHIVRSYAKWFGQSLIVAANELRMLGVKIEDKYIEQLKQNEINRSILRKNRNEMRNNKKKIDIDQNEYFAYIVGYTPNGFPYGVTWEEMEAQEKDKGNDENISSDCDNCKECKLELINSKNNKYKPSDEINDGLPF